MIECTKTLQRIHRATNKYFRNILDASVFCSWPFGPSAGVCVRVRVHHTGCHPVCARKRPESVCGSVCAFLQRTSETSTNARTHRRQCFTPLVVPEHSVGRCERGPGSSLTVTRGNTAVAPSLPPPPGTVVTTRRSAGSPRTGCASAWTGCRSPLRQGASRRV